MIYSEISHAAGPMYEQGHGWWLIPLSVMIPGQRPLDCWFLPLWIQVDGTRLLRVQVDQPAEIKEIKWPHLTYPEIESQQWSQSSGSPSFPPEATQEADLSHGEKSP
jgi:hypothetical protein